MKVGADVFHPAARVVCASNILWFLVPAAWSLELPEWPRLLWVLWAADIFLLVAALNYWLDGTRYSWKMWTDVVAVLTLCVLSTIHAYTLGGVTLYVAALAGAVFAVSFVINCVQTGGGKAHDVNAVWLFTFLSYRWGGLIAAVVVMGGTSDATPMTVWVWCWPRVLILSAAFYLHNYKVWHETLPLNRLADEGAAAEFRAAAVHYVMEVAAVCALCAALPQQTSWNTLMTAAYASCLLLCAGLGWLKGPGLVEPASGKRRTDEGSGELSRPLT